jgi:azurin
MTPSRLLLPLLIICSALNVSAFAGGQTSVAITAGDSMKFSTTKVEVPAGSKVTVTLKNEGNLPKVAMGHNWVLLKAGVDAASYSNAAMNAKDEDYQPKAQAAKVIAAIPVLGPGESKSVTFTAPAPGSYQYLCSFPAHCAAGMRGVLVVK